MQATEVFTSIALRKDSKAYSLTSLCNSLLDESRRLADNEGPNKVMMVQNKGSGKSAYKVNKPYRNNQGQGNKPRPKNAWKATKGTWCNHCKSGTHSTTSCFYLFPENAPEGWDSQQDPTVQGNKAF